MKQLLVMVLISGAIGWITNWVAIKMLFRPHREINFGLFKIQGLIPKRKAEIGTGIANIIQNELISVKDVISNIDREEFSKRLNKLIDDVLDKNLKKKVKEKFPLLQMFFTDKVAKDVGNTIKDIVMENQEKIFESDIVIGAGRVAFESLLNKTSLIAVGETEYMGFINKENLDKSLASNFGDIGSMKYPKIEKEILLNDIEEALKLSEDEKEELKNTIFNETNLQNIVDRIENKYFELYVNKKKYDIPVIMYHRVINNPENEGVHGTYIYENIFREHMQYLKDKNYTVITFKDLDKIGWRNRFEKDKKYIFITFDDGYKDNYDLAFPILKEFGFKATIFLMGSSTYNEWDVKASGEKEFPLMSVEMIKEMQDYGIEFGAHTFNHPKLNTLSNEEIEHQIVNVKKSLEEKIGKEIITFAYPYGILNDYAKKMAKKAGYTFALATDSGSVCLSDDLYQIRRIAIFPNTNLFSFKRKVAGNYNFIKIKREKRE